jgi:site-specific DNA-methyltransferase (adenine-specific)
MGKRGSFIQATKFTPKKWDRKIEPPEYFIELKRVSKNQIIFGANHFIENIPNANSSCWIVWDKANGETVQSDCELAWCSFKTAVRKVTYKWNGMLQGDMKNKEKRIHPTQKPIRLYEWLLKNYAKPGDKILDTHLGSGSSRIAAHNLGFDFWGYEIDEEYYNDQEQRFNKGFNTTLFDLK